MKRTAWIAYLVMLHAALALSVLKTDLVPRALVKAGLREAPVAPHIASLREACEIKGGIDAHEVVHACGAPATPPVAPARGCLLYSIEPASISPS